MQIEIITRCSRPGFLYQVESSIFSSKYPVKPIWHIFVDTSRVSQLTGTWLRDFGKHRLYFWDGTPGDWGYSLVNRLLATIDPGSWVYLLDDDNELHPEFFTEITDAASRNPQAEAFVFSQWIGGRDFTRLNVREAKPENVRYQGIDAAQFLLRRSFIGGRRFPTMDYAADGHFIEPLYKEFPEKFAFIERILSNYNSLSR